MHVRHTGWSPSHLVFRFLHERQAVVIFFLGFDALIENAAVGRGARQLISPRKAEKTEVVLI